MNVPSLSFSSPYFLSYIISIGIFNLWRYYPVMLWLDIPFQIMNFFLYGIVSEAVKNAGFDNSILTRLFCGITCGMISAGVTCPIDVCKTRIISRDKTISALKAQRLVDIQSNQFAMLNSSDTDNMQIINNFPEIPSNNGNVLIELPKILKEEGIGSLFLGIKQRLLYTGLANGIRLAAYGTSRMDLMMRSLDDL